MLGDGITTMSIAQRGAATCKLNHRVHSSPASSSNRAQTASIGTQLLRSLHLLSVQTMQMSSARSSKSHAFAWKGIDRKGNRQQGIAWQGLDESGNTPLSSVHTSGVMTMMMKRTAQQQWTSNQREVCRNQSALVINDRVGASLLNECMQSKRNTPERKLYRIPTAASLQYDDETDTDNETSSSSVEKYSLVGSVCQKQSSTVLFDSSCITPTQCAKLNYCRDKIARSRSACRSATTPSSTHPSIELFTSRSPDTTPKLYPGDDPITLGEGRRSGADASSHSRSTRSITDRNCNTKGLQESQCYHNALLSPTTANNQFKPIGARSELLNSHLHNNNNHFNATLNSEYGCGVDGLVAMGNHTMTMPRNGRCLYVNGLSSALQTSGAQYTVSMRKANKSSNMGTPGSSVKQAAGKEAEPKYTDPFQGAPHDFQQRIAELALLEADTIRNERYRKAKRKTRMDKDS